MTDITMRQLLKAGAHFGHQTRYWSPAMAPYLFGDRKKIHIINLEKTLPMLREAMNYLGAMTAQNNKVLFVGTKPQASKWVREHAIRCGSPYVDHRWLGGMLTNYKTVKNSIARLKELEERIQSGEMARLSKKEALSLTRECEKLDKTLSGIKNMDGLPDVLFVIDVEHEYIAVSEANKLGIPVVAVVDSNGSPAGVDYIIPGNDDSSRAIQLYLTAAADAIEESRMTRTTIVPGDDEYVEVNEEGEIIHTADDGIHKSPAVTERPAGDDSAQEKPAEKTSFDKDRKVVKKKVFRKKVAKKKTEAVETEEEAGDNDTQADRIREHAAKLVKQARANGQSSIQILAGQICSELKLENRTPNVCSALQSKKFRQLAGVELVEKTGPSQSTTTRFHYKMIDTDTGEET